MQSTSRSLFARCTSISLSYVIFNIFLSCLRISASTAAYHDESPSAGAPWPEHSPTSRYSSRTMLYFFTAREKEKRFKQRAREAGLSRGEGTRGQTFNSFVPRVKENAGIGSLPCSWIDIYVFCAVKIESLLTSCFSHRDILVLCMPTWVS